MYFPVFVGWFSAYAHRRIEGYLPYKDTGLFLTPLFIRQLSQYERLIGPYFFGLRYLGLAAVMGLATVIYMMLCGKTSSFGAALSFALFR